MYRTHLVTDVVSRFRSCEEPGSAWQPNPRAVVSFPLTSNKGVPPDDEAAEPESGSADSEPRPAAPRSAARAAAGRWAETRTAAAGSDAPG
ncbi:hypothetical protein BJA5080_02757 [Bradyrhizobium diazoefficiens SEMIA 5080]|uniref:Uncharacterized protein n=1 Tax=Bradyrhizobium diazoefficiens SEMIA 5080 TaxID=754504 RepID=A0A837CAY6_9BRAD|nr:hypothetical protein BJA5080_02757 [Bradyrhizobium diazoefficiens SEMIA 5080]